MSTMMKAVVIEKHGGPEVLEIKEVPKPSIEPGEVRDATIDAIFLHTQ